MAEIKYIIKSENLFLPIIPRIDFNNEICLLLSQRLLQMEILIINLLSFVCSFLNGE